ncbi:amino acid ABC transporter ATP-binding protein, partial [Clostridium perfringens]|nr:amino acid ABC transporter ATP-binding protein [Clostridium perfringens]
MIEIKNLEKSFKGNKILKNISFTLKEGEILTLLGPSGAGKTTILRILNGLETCDAGSISLDNIKICENGVYADLNTLKEIHKKIGLVFQTFNLFPHMSILENLILAPMHTLNLSLKEATDKALKILSKLSLEDKANAYPCELSGGQKQRVAIGRALMLNPNYICFDEPTSALDPTLTKDIANIIKSLAEENIGVLIITHDMEFAKKASSRVIKLESGEILKDLPSEEF